MKTLTAMLGILIPAAAMSVPFPKDAITMWKKAQEADTTINGNPAAAMHQTDTVKLDSDKFHILAAVCGDRRNREKVIWRFANKKGEQTVCTNKRAANIDASSYMTFTESTRAHRIHTYKRQPANDSLDSPEILVFGGVENGLPVDTTPATIGEYIVTNRTLNPLEKGMIETYLSVKYGVSLSKSSDYYKSDGSKVWDCRLSSGFNGNVFGIGIDSLSTLRQTKSTNSETDAVEIWSDGITEGEYILLGDNGGSLEFEEKDGAYELQRTWLVSHKGQKKSDCGIRLNILELPDKVMLKTVHKDGTTELTEPQSVPSFQKVTLDDGDKITFVSKDPAKKNSKFIHISAYPSPAPYGGKVNVSIRTESEAAYKIAVYDEEGHVLHTEKGHCEGTSDIQIKASVRGVMLIEAEARGVKEQTKVTVK